MKDSLRGLFQEDASSHSEQDDEPHFYQDLPMVDAIDCEILMHRDAHFSGNFDEMITYYREDGKGAVLDVSVERIEALAHLDKGSSENIAALLLSGRDAEAVSRSREMYRKMRDLYEKEELSPALRLLTDLILSEDPEAHEEILALQNFGRDSISLLIELLETESLYQSLFPSYGQAPMHVLHVLEAFPDESLLLPLFYLLGKEDFFFDEQILSLFKGMGEMARDFALQRLGTKPWSRENERAALICLRFSQDPKVQESAAKLLQDPDLPKDSSLFESLLWIEEEATRAEKAVD